MAFCKISEQNVWFSFILDRWVDMFEMKTLTILTGLWQHSAPTGFNVKAGVYTSTSSCKLQR